MSKKNLFLQILSQLDIFSDDLKDWTRLRLELGKYQTEDALNAFIMTLVRVILGLMVFFFGMIALSLGLGKWLGDAFYGFLATTGILSFLILLSFVAKPRFWRYQEKHEFWNKGKVGEFLGATAVIDKSEEKLEDKSKGALKAADQSSSISKLEGHGK